MLSLIAAVTDNGIIGNEGTLIWTIKKDLKHFRDKTMGKKMIMGRTTFESFRKPLPGREHIVLTRDESYDVPEGVKLIHGMEEALEYSRLDEEVFVIGGGEIYRKLILHCSTLYITWVHSDFEGDTVFPVEMLDSFELVESIDDTDDESGMKLTFAEYRKKTRKN
jgi:dihydrofolate reductase